MDDKARIASALLASARTDTNPGVRSVASGTLSRTCDPSEMREVFDMLGSDHPGMRRLAVHSLAGCKGDKAANAVLFALDDPSPDVRKEAIQALANMGGDRVLQLLSALERETSPDIVGETDPSKNPSLKSWAADVVVRMATESNRGEVAQYLGYEKPEMRVIALAALGKIGDESVLPEMRACLEGHNLAVRRGAAEALGKLRDADSVSRLCEIVADPGSSPILVCACAGALSAIGDTSAIEALAQAQRNASAGMDAAAPGFESWYWRHQVIAKAAAALGTLGSEWRVVPEALKTLVSLCRTQSHASDARWVLEDVYRCDIGFAIAVGKEEADAEGTLLGVFQDTERLCDLLENHKDWKIRSGAAKHLMATRDRGAVPKLVQAMHKNRNPDVRRGAVEALSAIGDEEIVPEFIETIRREMVPGVRAAAVRGLAGISGKAAVEHLVKLATDRAAEVRRVALEGLSHLGTEEHLPVIMAAAKDRDPNVRSTAALAIGFLRTDSALPSMIDMLKNDRDPAPRVSAAAALGFMSSSVAVGSLASALTLDPVPSVRSQAARSLGEIGDESVIAHLEDVVKFDADPGVRSHCVLALGRIAERLFDS